MQAACLLLLCRPVLFRSAGSEVLLAVCNGCVWFPAFGESWEWPASARRRCSLDFRERELWSEALTSFNPLKNTLSASLWTIDPAADDSRSCVKVQTLLRVCFLLTLITLIICVLFQPCKLRLRSKVFHARCLLGGLLLSDPSF